MIEEQIRIDKE